MPKTSVRGGFNSLECADLSALWSIASVTAIYYLNASQQCGGGTAAGQSGDRSPHSKELDGRITHHYHS